MLAAQRPRSFEHRPFSGGLRLASAHEYSLFELNPCANSVWHALLVGAVASVGSNGRSCVRGVCPCLSKREHRMLKFDSKAISEHQEAPLGDEGRWERVVAHWDERRGASDVAIDEDDQACFVVSVGASGESIERAAQLAEIVSLVQSQGGRVVGAEICVLRSPNPRTLLGSGVAVRLATRARAAGATMLVLDAELSPSQTRNLEDAAGIPICLDWIVRGDLTSEGGYRAADRLLTLKEAPSAILCINDPTAIGAIHAAHDLGLFVGNDVAISGFDGVADAAHMLPPLTTMEQTVYSVACLLSKILFAQLIGCEFAERQIKLRPKLIVRSSTGGKRLL